MKVIRFTIILFLLVSPSHEMLSQSKVGQWALGLHGGLNTLINDYNQRLSGPGGELTLRYGVTRTFSLGIRGGYEELKASQAPPLDVLPSDYVRLQSFPVYIAGWLHLMPGQNFSPFLYVGGGALIYKRQAGGKRYLPDDKIQTSVVIPVGLGFEAHVSRRVSLGVDVGFRLADDKLDAYRYQKQDSYVTAKAGLFVYLGNSPYDDDDNDGLTNAEEARFATSPQSTDTDGDGLRDGDEVKRYFSNPIVADTDGDGLNDGDEAFKYMTDPAKWDTDGDGLSDGDEILRHGTDPLKTDTDGDGLTDGEEVLKHKTHPLRVDTDADGLSDYDEVMVFKSDPDRKDTDGDGLNDGDEVFKYKTDPTKIDSDGGGVDDGSEVARGTNPLDPKDDHTQGAIILERGKSVILEGVTFNAGSARLTRESEVTLEKVFIALVANPGVSVEIAGHTDNVGGVETNNDLSLQRADAVKAWLVRKGIPAGRMRTVGWGMKYPIAPNDTPEGRARNRRIEFNVMK